MNKTTKTTPEFKRHKEVSANASSSPQMTEAEMIADAEMIAALVESYTSDSDLI